MNDKVDVQLYFNAVKAIKGSGYRAEEWLDENSEKLSGKAKTLQEAKSEVWDVMIINNRKSIGIIGY